MLRRAITMMVVAWVASTTAAGAATTPFDRVTPALQQYRSGTGAELRIRFSGTTFQVLQQVDETLTAERGAALLKTQVSPDLTLSQSGNYLAYEIGNTVVAQPVTSELEPDTSRQWKRRSWKLLGRYPRAQWASFLRFAIANGLSRVDHLRYQGEQIYTLSFSAIVPSAIDAGGRSLTLSEDFRAVMRLSPHFQPKSGRNGFVVLLHDPHENVGGRFQTLTGVRALIAGNTSVRFGLLVEGAYDDPREIGLSGLDELIKPGVQGAAVVSKLLSNYLINTPTAYRLLYDPGIAAYAIDDNELLRYQAPRHMRTRLEQSESLRRLGAAVQSAKVPAALKNEAATAVGVAYLYIHPDTDQGDMPESALVRYYDDLGKKLTDVAQQADQLRKAGVAISTADVSGFRADAEACRDQSNIYSKALERNRMMSRLIIEKARLSAQQVPVAFIGNYHTRGIIEQLQQASIGYVVIEPRARGGVSDAQREAFERANHPDTREGYLSSIALNMGKNVPTPAEVQRHYVKKIAVLTPVVEALLAERVKAFRATPGSAVQIGKLTTATSTNGALAMAQVSAGGNSPPPPGKFATAFAYFEPGERGGGPGADPNRPARLVIVNPKDARWATDDRYDFLRTADFTIPVVPAGFEATTMLLRQDPTSKRQLSLVYESRSKRVYCFDRDALRTASMVPVPTESPKRTIDVHIQLVEIVRYMLQVLHG